jgi:hypothetical protein
MTAINSLYLCVGMTIGAVLGALGMSWAILAGRTEDDDPETRAANEAFDEYMNSIVPKGDHEHHHPSDERFRR